MLLVGIKESNNYGGDKVHEQEELVITILSHHLKFSERDAYELWMKNRQLFISDTSYESKDMAS